MTCSPEAAPSTSLAWQWPATGTVWRIHHDGCVSSELAARAAALVDEDERRWSRFLPASEVSRVNARAGRRVAVSGETRALLEAAAAWQTRSDGVFDPLVGAALSAWGYARSMRRGTPHASASPAEAPPEGRLELAGASVRIPAGAQLDLGGIAKGWMADRLARLLREETPAGRILVDAGGDLVAARGSRRVAVAGEPAATLPLAEGEAAATSSWSQRSWRNGDGRLAHHLIDPATGAPGAQTSATVVGGSATEADVLATVLALRPERIAELAAPARVEANGHVRANAAWETFARPA